MKNFPTRFCIIAVFISIISSVTGFAQENIAVMELEAKNISSADVSVLTDKFRSEIIKTRKFNVMERERMNDILKEQGFQLSGVCSTDECATKAGHIIGVSKMIAGSIGKLGSSYLVTLRMIDIESGKIVRNVDETIKGNEEYLLETGMSQMVTKLLSVRDLGQKNAKPNGVPGNFGPSDGLLGFWPLDKKDGNSLTDLSGNGKHGSSFGCKIDIKGGLKFSGSGDYVTLGDLPRATQYTVSFWVNPLGIADQIWYDAMCGNGKGGIGIYVMLNVLHFSADPECETANPVADISYSMDNIMPGKWHHVAGVFSAGKFMALFVDGKELKRIVSDIPQSMPGVSVQYFGADQRMPDIQSYSGKARDVMVFDRALENGEVAALYSAGRNR